MYIDETHCCGVGDFGGLNHAGFTIEEVIKTIYLEGCHFGQIFMCVAWDVHYHPEAIDSRKRETYERRFNDLAKYLVDNNLGDFYDVSTFPNPSHEGKTMIRTGMFSPDQDAIKEWCEARDMVRPAPHWQLA